MNKGHEKDDDDLEKLKLEKTGDNFGATKKAKKDEPGFFKHKKVFFLSSMTVENKSPCFFGHFGIAITAAAMYSPFIYQTLIGLAYIVAMILALIFEAWKF